MIETPFASAKRIVVKTGSALVAEHGQPRHAWLEKLAFDIVSLRSRGFQIILVSSGAVALGRKSVGNSVSNRLDQKQAAAAIGQLQTWADRVGVPLVRGPEGGDPASIVFDAVKRGTDEGTDALIVDTAGRLQNKRELMDELAKIRKVLGRLNPEAPHDVVLVLDATNGQNALSQIDVFKEVAGVTGLIMTKLDGTARGGVLVAAAQKYGLPIHAIGVGEQIDDLAPFDPDDFAKALTGL